MYRYTYFRNIPSRHAPRVRRCTFCNHFKVVFGSLLYHTIEIFRLTYVVKFSYSASHSGTRQRAEYRCEGWDRSRGSYWWHGVSRSNLLLLLAKQKVKELAGGGAAAYRATSRSAPKV
jgi:hypothetical protein